MYNLIRRIKNLWEISAYQPKPSIDLQNKNARILEKDFPIIQKKLATIISTEEKDLLNDEIKIDD